MFTNNLFTSGYTFDKSELELKSKFQMINIALILSSLSLLFGIFGNVYKGTYGLINIEVSLISLNIVLFFVLRIARSYFKSISLIVTSQYSLFFLFLVYTYPPESMKFIWVFTYPIILLYFQNKRNTKYWIIFMISMILLAPVQNFIKVDFSEFQAIYFSFVLMVISLIIFFYQNKMDDARELIVDQQEQLQLQVNELQHKDHLLTIQSKQAVMGEMISMIAHQWRQPLSSVTLNISDIQIKQMLGEKIENEKISNTLQEISDTVVYLSDTIDDFQTYFNPNKEINQIPVNVLIKKAISFVKSRLDGTKIKLEFLGEKEEVIETYANELIQVLLNILNNAIDELEVIKKENAKIVIELKDEDDSFILSVSDNANGISKENVEKIFEPYFSTKDKNGTGLGLYMSQMIMEKQFSSKIDISTSKMGSRFFMRVPKKLS